MMHTIKINIVVEEDALNLANGVVKEDAYSLVKWSNEGECKQSSYME